MKRPENILLAAALVVGAIAAGLYSCDGHAAKTHIVRVTVHEDTALLRFHCPHDLACRVGHQMLIPGRSGLVCDRALAVVVHPEPQGRSFAEWREGAIHTVWLTWRHRGVAELGDALQQACGYWRRATTGLWGHELMHVTWPRRKH